LTTISTLGHIYRFQVCAQSGVHGLHDIMSTTVLMVYNKSCVPLVEPDGRSSPDLCDVDLVTDQSPDIVDSVSVARTCIWVNFGREPPISQIHSLDHGRSLERHSPTEDSHTLGQTHGFQHLWSEHSRLRQHSTRLVDGDNWSVFRPLTFPTSIHLFRPSWYEKISILGSV
jgi:hypothetical protein